MSNKDDIKRVVDEIESKFKPVKTIDGKPIFGKKAIVIVAHRCDDFSDKIQIVFNYTKLEAIAPEVNREISRLNKQNYRGIRVIKGQEIEYPFKLI